MHEFVDDANRTWPMVITVDTVRRGIKMLGINITDINVGEPPLLTRLGTEEMLLFDVIYCVVKPRADELGMTEEDFARSLGGGGMLSAQTALYQELTDFFLKRGRPDHATAVTAQKKMIELAIQKAKMALEAINPEMEINKIYGGNLSTNVPG